uniref:Integrator complex subunit 6 n=3 Tax=Schistocephalus solidus TaxID=70667 RepID=A0A0V0J6P0_SCHSO
MNKYRVDQYFIFTLNPSPHHIKLAGWRQSSDLQSLHTALSQIKPDGTVGLGVAIGNAFRLLNLNRMQVGSENYGMGIYMSYFKPAVVITVTKHDANFEAISSAAAAVPGGDLTAGLHRWDYRLYGILLQSPGLVDSLFEVPRPRPPEASSSLYISSKQTGGDAFVLSDLRAIHQCVEAVASKCQPGVVVELVDDSNEKELINVKQLVHVKLVGRVGSSWPIPENFWPDDELLLSKLPPRPSNPIVHICASSDPQPKFPEYFPMDKYELEPSAITRMIIEKADSSATWPCYIRGSGHKRDAPFGYCKATADLQTVYLHVLPYNYLALSNLLTDLSEVHGMRMTESWGLKFSNYLSTIPRYYFAPISKAFERLGFQGVINADSLDRTLPYQLKHQLQKLRQSAKTEYDQFVHIVETAESPPPLIKLPHQYLLRTMWSSELRAINGMAKPKGKVMYEQPCSIPRLKLRQLLPKLRSNLNAMLDGVGRPMDREDIHNQSLSEMGDYINYKFPHPQVAPLRELMPGPERLDTFGNPFRRKAAAAFVADEGFVEDTGFPTQSCSPNTAAITVPGRRRSSLSSMNQAGRSKGPLPAYITYANWRKLSRSSSLAANSPQQDDLSPCASPVHTCDLSHGSPQHSLSPPNAEFWRDLSDMKKQKLHFSEEKISFDVNHKIVNELIDLVRRPSLDGGKVFQGLTSLVGNVSQRYASVSFVMAESLRFKRMELYKLLGEWRSCLCLPQIDEGTNVLKGPPTSNSLQHATAVNGLG